ncbi:unnamed protein product [Haemonchus placei]|uniref:Velvet domain-containing protein n=1 Tax=Haemonchus placei TaxID=6290 RepID=A0A0N4WSU1_HAEPC|nr:unnamed protein product [Haemonchus placei]
MDSSAGLNSSTQVQSGTGLVRNALPRPHLVERLAPNSPGSNPLDHSVWSVYCMNVEKLWTNSADKASPGIIEPGSPNKQDQTVFDNPVQANDLFNVHVSKHHDRFICKREDILMMTDSYTTLILHVAVPIESCYMNVLPSYRVQYYVRDNRKSAGISRDEVAIPEAALGTNEQQVIVNVLR